MNYTYVAFLIFLSYLYGSIPFGLVIGKLWKGIDIRTLGSKNIGATNVLRTLGPGAAVFSFLGDLSKGVIAVSLGRLTGSDTICLLCGLTAIAGHNWSVFLRFSGGRGISTTIGVFIMLMPIETFIVLAIWGLVVLITRYVSLGSIVSIASLPIQAYLFGRPNSFVLFSALIAIMAIYKHRANISRLLAGTEFKIGQRVDTDGSIKTGQEKRSAR